HAVSFFCMFFSLTVVVIDFNFLYRYWAVSNPHLIKLFSTIWFVIMLFCITAVEGAAWYSTGLFLLEATPEARMFIAEALYQKYGIDSRKQSMLIADYWRDGHYNIKPVVGICYYSTVLSAGFSFMIFCGLGIVRNLAKASQNMSAKTKKLQYALFRIL
ncbi:hypothetical protein PFISCL1PPCAC_14001, partial [Pristionchus fissidentatus]